MKWDQETTYRLLQLYEQNPILWKKSLLDYKNVVKRGDAIRSIAENFDDCIDNDVKTKIRSLRKVHAEKLRQIKVAKKKSSLPHVVKWEYFNAMEFLLGETTAPTAPSPMAKVNKKRKRDLDSIDIDLEERKITMDKPLKNIDGNENDDDRKFSNIVYGFLDDLKDQRLKELARMKFRSVMNEISTIRCNEFFEQQKQQNQQQSQNHCASACLISSLVTQKQKHFKKEHA